MWWLPTRLHHLLSCRYLFTEWEDQEFGSRASSVHGALVNALSAAGRLGEAVWTAIRKQTEMMTQLAYISKELKVRGVMNLLLAQGQGGKPLAARVALWSCRVLIWVTIWQQVERAGLVQHASLCGHVLRAADHCGQ